MRAATNRGTHNTTTTDELRATTLLCRNDLAYPSPVCMGLFDSLVSALGGVQPVP
jgi:hypothetical protein